MPALPVGEPPHPHLTEDGLQRALVAGLDASAADPVAVDDPLDPYLPGGTQVEMVLKQQPQQLPTVGFETIL